jgi:ADP-ribosylglycohydrolase
MNDIVFEKVAGVIFGTAIGDGIGAPVEFLKGPEVDRVLAQHVAEVEAGKELRYTDDTQLTIAVMEGLLDNWRADIDASGEAVALRLREWAKSPENNRAPGNACLAGAARLERGVCWRMAGADDARGCGSAMRSAPYGIKFWRNPRKAACWALEHSRMTHGHPAALKAAGFVAEVCARFLQDESIFPVLERLGEHPLCKQAMGVVGGPRRVLDELQGWTGDSALAAAARCISEGLSVSETLLCAARHDGDSDSVAAIVGAWLGAKYGFSALPWRATVEGADYLAKLAERACEALEVKG